MGRHPKRSGNFLEDGSWIHSHHPENAGLEDRLLYQKNESEVQASISHIKDLTYAFSQLRQRIERL